MGTTRTSIEKTLDLLWAGLGQPKRGPRHQLTVERVVGAAMDAVEADGVEALSMRKVAARLGVGAATLYTYVPDRSALLALMVEEMIGQAPLPHTRPGTWREKVETWAREDLESFRAHPWLVEVTGGAYIGPNGFAWTDSAIRVFDGTGLSAEEAMAAVDAVDGLVRGHVAKVVADDRAARWTDPEGRSFATVQESYLTTYRIEPGRFPAVERLADPLGPVEAFERALGWLLDGVEQRIAECGTGGTDGAR
ncbi:TetR/AcrR family transcriptional regulator C-terminal domain-containing protein [Nocardiopsis sp. HNM0947]|uniref:TetR/AcrR family transcriptional regulator C-terminal domain-containing protein n=1 Tax=Nocardiopsis coralli TaxID=2772213 RepID=A0ABR9PDS1_9ACTN|nr:TetR/AcrR family transcriptional regulator C-terminal domain-containing protein [Nocardiopsis coralli]MBE3001971.1 TetR/AcrR family transcriptional regulator C-terminal domain-containing protein [Nocardiopsis coralli]